MTGQKKEKKHTHTVKKTSEKKGKTITDENGYLRFEDSDKYVHLWVAGQKYKNQDFSGKEVHHLDGNKKNNNKDNLILLQKNDHFLLHQYQKINLLNERRIIKPWAWMLLITAVVIQVPFFWAAYITQFFTVILVLIVLLAGTEKK